MKKLIFLLIIPLVLVACGNSRAEEVLQAYEKIADELVEARASGDYKRQMEISLELQSMQAEYSDIKADRDLNNDQRKRLAEVMKKITSGGYEEMIEKITNQYLQVTVYVINQMSRVRSASIRPRKKVSSLWI